MFEAHPVPQNVTEFQFHLVGDMTIKQFIYLASGLGSAYLVFALFANNYPFVAYPLIVILAGSGAALAFLPIQERPLDHWLAAYFRAIFQPTKRVFKSKILTKEDPLFKSRLQVFLNTRRKATGPVFKDQKTKSTPFSFSVQSINQTPSAPQPLITPPAPAGTIAPVAPPPAAAIAAAPPLPSAAPIQRQPLVSTIAPITSSPPAPVSAPQMSSPPHVTPSPITSVPPIKPAPAVPNPQPVSPPPPAVVVAPPPPPQPVPPPPPKAEPQVLGTAGLSPIDIPEAEKPKPLPEKTQPAVIATTTNPIVIEHAVVNVVSAPAPTPTPPQQTAPVAKPVTPPPPPPKPPSAPSRPIVPEIPIPQKLSGEPKATLPAPAAVTSAPHPAPEMPTEADLSHTIELAKQVHQVQQKILKTEEQIETIRTQAAAQDANPKQYLSQFHQLLGELQNLNQQAANLSSQVATLTNEPVKLPSLQADLVVKAKSIPTITLTSIANVINGIVTDSNGNYLDGSIILAHDKSGIPVRALKTNKLGQFVAATPLNNGIYTITIEKDDLVFDTIELELKGEVLKPILITSKPVVGGVVHG